MFNFNKEAGIPYTYFSADKLDPELVCELQDHGEDLHYEEAKEAARFSASMEFEDSEDSIFDRVEEAIDFALEELAEEWEDNEPVHQGLYEGVKYLTCWLGGALLVCVKDSPHRGKFAKCSPCLPGALDGDTPGEYEGFDVPEDWKRKD